MLAPKCVSNTSLGMRGDSMFCIFVLHKTKVSVCVSLKTVNSKPACVFIVVILYRPSREVKDTTPSGAESKNFPVYALLDGQGKF